LASPLLLLAIVGLASTMEANRERLSDELQLRSPDLGGWLAPTVRERQRAATRPPLSLEEPITADVVAQSVERARLLSGRPGDGVSQFSRDCHRRLRAAPSLMQHDRCAAFDLAAAALQPAGMEGGGGRFGPSEMTARQMVAGNLLSSDFLSIERRLERIRALVDQQLAPPPPEPVPLPELEG